MAANNITKCGHPPCRCKVDVEEQFCSEACANAEDVTRNPCPCGHLECAGVEEAVEDDELDAIAPGS